MRNSNVGRPEGENVGKASVAESWSGVPELRVPRPPRIPDRTEERQPDRTDAELPELRAENRDYGTNRRGEIMAEKRWEVVAGDCFETLKTLADCSVDSVVTDPPYGLKFMGKAWDHSVPSVDVWRECLRVLKPGGHLLAFAGTRTQHRMACAIEDAGFDIRDMIAWVYGVGFPKSHDVSKAIDKAAGKLSHQSKAFNTAGGKEKFQQQNHAFRSDYGYQYTPATDAALQWQGWGTALKPALEPITVARKPLCGTVADNVLEWGTGAINVDGCRVGETVETWPASRSYAPGQMEPGGKGQTMATGPIPPGRWPANIIHDGSDEVVGLFPNSKSDGGTNGGQNGNIYANGNGIPHPQFFNYGDSGSAARFFYCAKASKRDRDDGCESNNHPTVKPTELMRYLVRLVTPPGGLVLDPFAGTGSTGRGAILEGFCFLGCEIDANYAEIARLRIKAVAKEVRQPELF